MSVHRLPVRLFKMSQPDFIAFFHSDLLAGLGAASVKPLLLLLTATFKRSTHADTVQWLVLSPNRCAIQ